MLIGFALHCWRIFPWTPLHIVTWIFSFCGSGARWRKQEGLGIGKPSRTGNVALLYWEHMGHAKEIRFWSLCVLSNIGLYCA